MASSAAVEIISVKEAVYGQTPTLGTAHAETVRFTSETLSGTPITTTSAELRRDRMSGGQVVTGLESGGDINFELSKNDAFEDYMSGAMMSTWVTGVALPSGMVNFTKDATDPQKATVVFTGSTGNIDGTGRALLPGDVIVLNGFANAANNGPIQVVSIVDATSFIAIVPRGSITQDAANGTVTLGDYLDIGSVINSWTLSKAYTDVPHLATTDQHSQRYTGSIVNGMSLSITYGEIVNGTFSFLSNGYMQEYPSLHQKIEGAGGTVDPSETDNPMNGSVDMPLVTVGGQPTDFCIQSVNLALDNGSTPQNCIGLIAPTKYNIGTANITIDMSIYLGDQSYDKFMPGKISQTPISFMFAAVSEAGGYAFDLRAVQLSFPDPAASGDQPVMIEASGVAKVGPNNTSALRIWRWEGTATLPFLNNLTLSNTSFVPGVPSSGSINGATSGSNVSASGLPTGLTINGSARTWSWDGTGSVGTYPFTLTETLANATNSPRTSNITANVVASIPALGALTLSDTNFVNGTPENGTINGASVGSTISATGLPSGLTINGAARTWNWSGSGTVGTPMFTLTETLTGAPNSPRQSSINVTIAAATITLGNLTLSDTAFVVGTAENGLINGATVGSTINATGLPTGLTIDGVNRTWNWSGSGSAGTPNFTLTETLAGASNSPKSNTINLSITPAVVTLGNLTLSDSAYTVGVPENGQILGATAGSTISITGPPAGFTINSVNRSWDWDGTGTAGNPAINLVETLGGATNSPKSNNLSLTISAPPITLGTLTFSDATYVVGVAENGPINGATAGSTISATGLPTGLTIDGVNRTWNWDGSGVAGAPVVTLTETLAGAENSPHNSTVNVNISAAPPTLNALTFSDTAFVNGTPENGFINGATAGSTISATGLPSGLTIDGANRTWDWNGSGTVGSPSFTLTETLAGATNTPRNSTINTTIAAAPIVLSALSLSDATYTVGASQNGVINGATVGSTIVGTNLPTGFTINGTNRTWSWNGAGAAGTPTITLTETLATATNSPRATNIGLIISDVTANTINAPVIRLNSLTAYPPSGTIKFDVETQVDDVLRFQASPDENFLALTIDATIPIDDTAITAGEIAIPGLGSIASPAVTNFRAWIERGASIGEVTIPIKHGDLTPSIITSSLAPTVVEGEAYPTFLLTANMGISSWHIEGDDIHHVSLINGNTIRIDAITDYEVKFKYNLKVRAINYAGVETWATWAMTVSDVNEPTNPTVLSSIYKGNLINLDAAQLTASVKANSGSHHRIRSNQKRPGLRYFEINQDALERTNDSYVGITHQDLNFADTGLPGAGSAHFTSLGNSYNGAGTAMGVNAAFQWFPGSRMGFAVNPNLDKMWRRNATGWDGDPVAGTGGLAIPAGLDEYFIYLGLIPVSTGFTTTTLIVNPANFAYPIPSGYAGFV